MSDHIQSIKGKIEFDLTTPDGQEAFRRHAKATDMAIALFEITHNLHRRVERELASGADNAVDSIYQQIEAILDEQGIIIEDIIN